MNKRDLEADLELCAKLKGIHESQRSHAQTRKLDVIKLPEMTDIASHAIERALVAEAKLDRAQDIIQRWFDGEISAFGVMDALIIDLGFDIDGIPDEVLEYYNIKRKEVLGDA